MSEFVWKSDYEIGHAMVDKQHQYLFDLANSIVEAKSKGEITKNVMLLYKYVREHFRDEERLMKDIEYPDYQTHKQIHNQLLDKLNEISEKVAQGSLVDDEIKHFMQEWLLKHILIKDGALGKYLNE